MTKTIVTFPMLSFGAVHGSRGRSSHAGWVHAHADPSSFSPFPSLRYDLCDFTFSAGLLRTELNGNSSGGLLLVIHLFVNLFTFQWGSSRTKHCDPQKAADEVYSLTPCYVGSLLNPWLWQRGQLPLGLQFCSIILELSLQAQHRDCSSWPFDDFVNT